MKKIWILGSLGVVIIAVLSVFTALSVKSSFGAVDIDSLSVFYASKLTNFYDEQNNETKAITKNIYNEYTFKILRSHSETEIKQNYLKANSLIQNANVKEVIGLIDSIKLPIYRDYKGSPVDNTNLYFKAKNAWQNLKDTYKLSNDFLDSYKASTNFFGKEVSIKHVLDYSENETEKFYLAEKDTDELLKKLISLELTKNLNDAIELRNQYENSNEIVKEYFSTSLLKLDELELSIFKTLQSSAKDFILEELKQTISKLDYNKYLTLQESLNEVLLKFNNDIDNLTLNKLEASNIEIENLKINAKNNIYSIIC